MVEITITITPQLNAVLVVAALSMWFSTSRQMIYAIRTKKTRDNVWDALVPNFVGCVLYSLYAYITWQPMFFIGDAVDGAMIGVILFIKFRYKVVEVEEEELK